MSETQVSEPPDFPMARTCPFDPPPPYARLRERSPVSRVRLPDGSTAWLVTGHELVRAILSDPRVSADRADPGFPAVMPGAGRQLTGSLLGMDPPEHAAHRRMLTNEFTVRRIRAMRPQIQQVVDTPGHATPPRRPRPATSSKRCPCRCPRW